MKVFKFGGASIKDAQGILNVVEILKKFHGEKIAVVVSAMGKTTNELEEVIKAYFKNDGSAYGLLEQIKNKHIQVAADLKILAEDFFIEINDLFVEVEWVLEVEPEDSYDYVYDQIVSIGELASTKLIYHTLKQHHLSVSWADARGMIYTDEIHREAKVNWELTKPKLKSKVFSDLEKVDIVVTQGFIGSTTENHTTTLGREGSDYTAAIVAYCCDAESMHIWKDVPGVLTADPKVNPKAERLSKLSYDEAIEMTYYGAKVIHPKTIKPLQNKNISLHVRPFSDPADEGTIIADYKIINYPPILVVEKNQALLHISVNDFSFVAEEHLAQIFKLISLNRIKVNMMKNTAISFTLCVLDDREKLVKFQIGLPENLKLECIYGIEIITVRHFTNSFLDEVLLGREVLFEDRHKQNIQLAVLPR
jgi:aspartate kinase